MGFVCLAYHRVTDAAAAQADPLTVRPAQLQAQLRWLAARGYRGVSLSAALAAPDARQIALTFDDGYADFYEEAWPIVRAAGCGATLAVVSGRLGQQADWAEAAGATLLTAAQVRTLADMGVEIAAHGEDHRALERLPPAAAYAAVAAAREKLAALCGVAPPGLVYPYGRYTPWLAEVIAAAGYAWAATARGGRNGPNTARFALRRTVVRGRDDGLLFALKARSGYGTWLEARMDLLRVR
jgi:peptidoglycan/xylan/chitin deacetylase (PgdA/CDA1 family)